MASTTILLLPPLLLSSCPSPPFRKNRSRDARVVASQSPTEVLGTRRPAASTPPLHRPRPSSHPSNLSFPAPHFGPRWHPLSPTSTLVSIAWCRYGTMIFVAVRADRRPPPAPGAGRHAAALFVEPVLQQTIATRMAAAVAIPASPLHSILNRSPRPADGWDTQR